MQGKSQRSHGYRTAFWATAVLMGTALTYTPGQDVILNPIEITGRVRVGNEALEQVQMRATSGSLLATQAFTPDASDLTTVNYSLTVDVPAGGDRTYAVRPQLILMDGVNDRLYLLDQDVLVVDGTPGSADFIIDPGYIEGTITITGSEVMANAIVHGLYTESPSPELCTNPNHAPCFAASTSTDRGFAYRMAVPPGAGIQIRAQIFLLSGAVLVLDPIIVDIAAGETVVQDIVVPSPQGSINGTIGMPGAGVPSQHLVFVQGAAQKFLDVAVGGPYEITGLPDGDYTFSADSFFGEPSASNTFGHPDMSITPSRSVSIAGGQQVTVDILTEQASLEGTVSLSGSASNDDLTDIYFSFFGKSAETTGGWTAGNLGDAATGAYRFVASQGAWYNNQISFSMTRAGTQLADQFSESIILSYVGAGLPEIQVTTGETSAYDADVPMGKVIVRFAVLGGLSLSDPRLELGCSQLNQAGQLMTYINGNSRSQNQADVTQAVTSFLAPAGNCLATARAVVNGTLTSFGQVEVEVEAGVTKELEVGAPTLIIDYPSPDLEVDTQALVVLGRASDDVAVASVTINGGSPLTLASTGNQDDPIEVSFTGQELSLVPGANVIETTAEDDAGNTTTDTRTVFFVTEGSPPTLNWTPADGATTNQTTVTVTGMADDAEGIASITVNGTEVPIALTGSSTQPNEVSFTTTATLVPGDNPITVVATNLSELQTTQTHTVTLTSPDNSAPVADAGDDIVQPCAGHCDEGCGTQVTLDGSGSSDADEDDLTYTWTGPFPEGDGTVTGVTAVVTLPLGPTEITLTVDDGTEQSTDTVMVTVALEVTGLKPPLAGLVPAGETPPLPRRAFNRGSTLPLRFTLRCAGEALSSADIPAPEIVAIVDGNRQSVDLSQIDPDAGASNDNTLFFRSDEDDEGQWIYNLNTKDLAAGMTYTITIRMPDGQDYQARFELRPGRMSRGAAKRR